MIILWVSLNKVPLICIRKIKKKKTEKQYDNWMIYVLILNSNGCYFIDLSGADDCLYIISLFLLYRVS